MKTLLRIDASIRREGSHSRALGDYFEDHWQKANPNGTVIHRDLLSFNLPHLNHKTVEGFHTPENSLDQELQEALELSNTLIAELKSVDELLVCSPLYNFCVPSSLKAYFDHVTRAGHTFKVNAEGAYQGLINLDSAYLITTKGSVYKGTPMEKLDFQEPYINTMASFLGFNINHAFSLEGTSDHAVLKDQRTLMEEKIQTLFKIN